MRTPKIYIALPVLNERENLPALIECIYTQSYSNFTLVACVNQPESWWDNDVQLAKCIDNLASIEYLKQNHDFSIYVIDKSTKGNAWDDKKYGVGWARKTCMDYINTMSQGHDIMLSLDADTSFGSNYFQSVIDIFRNKPLATALSNPYYHKLIGEEDCDRAILHYEIYMRYYLYNMLRIQSPYAFTALGSAIATPVWAYRKINGMAPKISGEDFYFLQQLAKVGKVLNYNSEKVYPAARFSDRVAVGTGPAMIKGREDNWKSYPIYSYHAFDEIDKFYQTIPELYTKDIPTVFTQFLENIFKTQDLWSALRANFKTQEKFMKACHEKADGLRILQFLKQNHQEDKPYTDEENLKAFIQKYFETETLLKLSLDYNFTFKTASIEQLDAIRNFLEEQCFKSFIS